MVGLNGPPFSFIPFVLDYLRSIKPLACSLVLFETYLDDS